MPVNRRSRSFSPYSYSIQYKKAGEGPAQKPHPYVNAAVLSEEQLVISKKTPNWVTYATSEIYYTTDSDCLLHLEKIVTTFSIVSAKEERKETFDLNLKKLEYPNQKKEYDLNDKKSGVTWLSLNEAFVYNPFYTDVDFIIIADGKYINVEKIIKDNEVHALFDSGFNRYEYENLVMVVYSIDYAMSEYTSTTIQPNQIFYDQLNDKVYFNNPYGTNKVIPRVYDENDKILKISNPDLSPSWIILDNHQDLVYVNSILSNRLEELNTQINAITERNPDVPSSVIYASNNEFRSAINEKSAVEAKLNEVGSLPYVIKINKVALYSYKFKDFSTTLRYGVNADGVTWLNSSAIIKHNLNGRVNVIVDDAFNMHPSFTVHELSENEIKITFSNPKYAVCNVRIFKIG